MHLTRQFLGTIALILGSAVCSHAQGLKPHRSAYLPDAAPQASPSENVGSPDSFSISRYVIAGHVLDDQGAPVEGAALHIGRQIAYTNSSGRFTVHSSRPGAYPFSIAREELVRIGIYEVLSAPDEVHAEPEETATGVQVVVRRIPPSQEGL